MRIKTGKKGQTVVEALMTYGWMIVLVAAVLIVVFLLGLFSPLHFISPSSTISGFTGVKVTAVIANYSYMEFYLTNSLSVSVNLNKFSLLYNNTKLSNVSCQYLTLSPGQNSICFTKLKLANTRDTVSLGIGFAVSSAINASSNGTMSFVPANINLPLPSIITEFSEDGLPTGSQWWVDFKGINHTSTGTEILFASVPGNYSFTVGNTSFNGCTFTALPSSGYSEAGLLNNIIFINSCAATFIEKELPLGTKWQVDYAGLNQSSTTNLLVFTNEKSGTYPYSVNNSVVAGCVYQPSPSSGSLTVGQYQYIRFLGECTTAFTESGLPNGYKWDMSFDGVGKDNTTSNIYYFGPPGNYSYSISTLSNSSSTLACTTTYSPSPSSGKAAAGSTVLITFSAETTCTTTFTESGLPSGYNWEVTYASITNNANAPSNIVFITKTSGSSIPTYPYSIPTLTNSSSTLACTTTYTPSPSSGSAEAGTTNAISYSGSTACITTFTETGLSSGITWSVTYNSVSNNSIAPSNVIFHTTTSGGSLPSYSYTINSISPNSSSTLDCTTATTPSPSSGSAQVGSTISVSFSEQTTCITTFDESNLPSSYPWNVTFNNVEKTSSSSSIQFTTTTSGGSIPSYSYSVPSLTSTSVEWNFGTSSYQGNIYEGMPTQAFPSSLSDLNNNGVSCGSPYNSQGYTAVAYMYFTSSITVTITTDDAMEVFYAPYGTNSWSSVFGGNAWHGQGATQYGPTTVSVTPGWYEVAVDWTNICAPGMSAFEINGAYMLSSQFNVIGWTPSNSSVQLLPYSDVTANPADPSGITVEQTGSWSHEFNGYFTYTYTPSPSSGTVSAGSTNSISFSTSGSSTTEFYEINLPSSASSWSVSYDNGAVSGSASTGSPITLSLSSQSSQSSYTATATANAAGGAVCRASASVEEGTTYTFTNWECYIPITVYNPSSSATPSPFDQEIFLDTNLYSSILSSNMQNVEFQYSNGTVIDSWYEGNYENTENNINQVNAIFWLNLAQIAGGGSENIYAVVYYPSINLFNGNTVGEAPQLSSSYAQYDNGGNVFFEGYWNYAGTSLPSGFSTVNTGGESGESISVNNGLFINYTNNWWYVYGVNGPSYNPSLLVQADMKISDFNGMNLEMGWPASDSGSVQSYGPCSVFHGYTITGNGAGGYSLTYNPGTNNACTTLSSVSTTLSNNTFYTYTAYWEGTGNEGGSVSPPYLGTVYSTNTSVSQGNTNFFLGLYDNNAGQGGTESIQWTRLLPYTFDTLSPSFSNPGGLSSGYSVSYPPGILSTVNYPYTNSSAPSCNGYELASSSDHANLYGECNWQGGSLTIYNAGGNAGYASYYIVTSAGQISVSGYSDNRCLDTSGNSAELSLYLPAQTLYVHVGTGAGGGSCGNGGMLIN
ncbi:MAG: hypothetical protein ACP5MV_03405 [Candidatus Parvarchaeum sp.]